MPKRSAVAVPDEIDHIQDNGEPPDSVNFSGDDSAAISEAAAKLHEQDAANPTDDFDPANNLKRVLKLRTKVENARVKAESAKASLQETDEYTRAKAAREAYKGLVAELDELLEELGREYPLFERREA
jgi:multidrug resistance efflux pump